MYQKKIKENNEKKIFHYIYMKEKDVCAADIANLLDMSFPTVKGVLGRFLEKGIIKESFKSSSGTGRKAQNYCLSSNFCYSIGLKIEREKLHLMLANEKGKSIREVSVIESFTKDNLTARLEEEIENFLDSIPQDIRKKLLGLGISIPGVVDKLNGKIEIGPNFKLEDRFIEELSNKLNLKILIENEANLSAIAEKFLGIGADLSDFMTLTIGNSIGMGGFREESHYGSFYFKAGRIEHMGIEVDGRKCECGHSGCWGAYISEKALLNDFKKKFPQIKKYSEIFKGDYLQTEIGKELLDRYLKYLAHGIKNLIFLSNPEKLIIVGEICKHSNLIDEKLRDYIYENSIFLRGRDTIAFSKFNEKGGILGAAIMPIIDTLF